MARVTVEDCIEKVSNRFELVMVASQRARRLGSGAALTVDRDNDKNPVVALREIADSTVNVEELREELVKNNQRVVPMDDTADVIDQVDGEAEWSAIAAAQIGAGQGFEDIPDDEDDEDEEEFTESSLDGLAGGSIEDEAASG